jgi:formate dehydrogenase iron-sulfur subunit
MYNNNKWIENRAKTDGATALLADENWTVVRKAVVKIGEDREVWRFCKQQCMHCKEPSCVSACPSHAFQKDKETGAVLYYPRNCIGCRYCMIGCPFNIPKFEWDNPLPIITKCMMCNSRIVKGEVPVCIATCPTNVMKFGELDDLLAEAKAKIAGDSRYEKHIYGEEEAGGTCWIYISDVPFEKLGFRTGGQVKKQSYPKFTEKFMHLSPVLGGIWFVILSCLYFITRRNEVKTAAKKYKKGKKEKV